MGSRMLIDATHAEETRVVVSSGSRIEEFDFESATRRQLKGNIYLAKVTRVEPSLQAAFVDYGGNRHGFLAFAEIHPDYYQIPVADRQALIREQEEEARQEEEENQGDGEEASTGENNGGDGVEEGNGEATMLEGVPEPRHGLAAETASGVETVDEDPESQKVESIGAEDALEEVPRRSRKPQRRVYKIQEVIKRRQVILVQVVKEERGNKGAALTTYLSLAGRYCVLMPNTARGGGISRKITDAGDRRRLKDVARDIETPAGMGLIVRTAGAQRTKTEIKRDYDYLIRLWENVRDLTLTSIAPALVYEEGSLIKRAIRDLYTKDVEEVQVEGEEAYREAKEFMKMLMPSHARNVKLYKEPRPLFSRYQVETQLDALFSPSVTLPSGGYMVMNQTEALVSIDINSGKSTREHNIEDTALRTNLEASDEIARQLRLRDLAGLIVIDFIDMEEKRNNRSVERRLKDALKNDRARIQVGHISHFGLLEMSRQRLRPSLLEGSTRLCPHCEGKGIIRSVSSCALSVLRSIEDHLMSRKAENLTVKCAREVASYILNEKRDNLLGIETSYGISVFVVSSDDIRGSQAHIERASERAVSIRKPQAAPVKIDSAFQDEEEATPAAAEPEIAVEETGAKETGGEDEGDKKHRRRGRRGSGRRSEAEAREASPDVAVPGLGDQPEIRAEPEQQPAAAPVGEQDAGSGRRAPADDAVRESRRGDGRRSDQKSRSRHRDGGRSERPPKEASTHGDGGSMRHEPAAGGETGGTPEPVEPPAPPPAEPPAAASTAAAPVLEDASVPRKWKPPAATVAKPTASKGGWWSKRA